MEDNNKSGQNAKQIEENVRNILMQLSDGLGIVVNAVQQLSLNFNAIEHYIAEEVQHIPKDELDARLSKIKKILVDELVEQVKDNSQVRKAAEEIRKDAEQIEKEKSEPKPATMKGILDDNVHSA